MNKEKLEKLNELFEKEVERERLKGASLLVEHKGTEVFRRIYGSDKKDSIYKLYSMTKPVTAVAVMLLYERGTIDLYDPVDKYLKGFKNMKVSTEGRLADAKRQITIKDLMNMTSGLVYPGGEYEAERVMEQIRIDLHERAVKGEKFTNVDICNALAGAPLLFQPGEGWRYGISADIAAGIVEVAAGISYGEFLQKEIFEPLEMKDTGFYVKEPDRLAVMYSRDQNGVLHEADEKALAWLNLYAPDKPPYIESGGGGLYSTLEDYRHFVRMLSDDGVFRGKRILGRKTVDYIRTSQLNEEQKKWVNLTAFEGYGYGNFMRVMINPAEGGSNGSVGEYGWDGLAGSYFMIDPEEKLTLIYMQQIEQGGDLSLRRKMRQIVYGALED